MQRAAQPDEIAPSYVLFASNVRSSYYTREVLAPIGGQTPRAVRALSQNVASNPTRRPATVAASCPLR
jgi:hypothetical protein